MRTEEEIKRRLKQLEDEYDAHDPPASSIEEEKEVAILRAMEELEWVLGERNEAEFTT
jgi:hypothetical protein